MPSGVRPEVDDIGLLANICATSFDPVSSLIAYSSSLEVDWAWVDPAQRWYPYQFSSGQVYDVPEWRLMSTRHDAAGNSIPASDVEHTRVMSWRDCDSLDFIGAYIMVLDAYGGTIDDAALFADDSGVSGLADDDHDCNLGNNPLSRNADVRASLRVDFMAIQTRCRELNLTVPYKVGNVFGLALQALDA